MSRSSAVVIGVSVAAVLGILIMAKLAKPSQTVSTTQAEATYLVRAHSQQTGPVEAKVTLVEFGDYQCPACGAIAPAVTQLTREFGPQLRLVFRNFPLAQHSNAERAAAVAEAAGQQGQFWAMHDLLYQRQAEWVDDLSQARLRGYAQDLGLDPARLMTDMSSQEVTHRLDQDKSDGQALQIPGTPTFYLNGVIYQKALRYSDLKSAIMAAMKG